MWTTLENRIDTLPLIVAGPLVRQVKPDSVTIWVALKESRTVTLRIYSTASLSAQKFIGTASTVQLGDRLHVVAVTAAAPAGNADLAWGELYAYNLFFNAPSPSGEHLPETAANLNTAGILVATPTSASDMELLRFPGQTLPTFVLPPTNLNELLIVHASCRKPHGERFDALEALDAMLESSAGDPKTRPHQLYLTGDQIYADDVADALLYMVSDAGATLLGWAEPVPDVTDASTLRPGHRADVVMHKAGLTPTIDSRNPFLALLPFVGPTTVSAEIGKSHLIKLGEYYAMYLFAWSDKLWMTAGATTGQTLVLPDFNVVHPGEKKTHFLGFDTDIYERFETELAHLKLFYAALPKVRRVLANTATYMMFDDHEITDDWYLNLAWCERVLDKPLGRFIIRNGLLAFAFFQAWGNTPEQFKANQPGRRLLEATEIWAQSHGSDGAQVAVIDQLIDLPRLDDIRRDKRLTRSAAALQWHYQVTGPAFQALVLDTRTWRSFPGKSSINFASLLSEPGFKAQLLDQPAANAEITLVISPAPVIGVPFIEEKQADAESLAERFAKDTEAWSIQTLGFEGLLGALAARIANQSPAGTPPHRGRIVLLSGDVHYGYAARLQYWANTPFHAATPPPVELTVVQLTASSLKNENGSFLDPGTRQLHTTGFVSLSFLEIFRNSLPEPPLRFGWRNADNSRLEVGTRVVSWILGINSRTIKWLVSGSPAIDRFDVTRADSDSLTLTHPPDWRYRIDYILSENEVDSIREITPRPVAAPPADDRRQALLAYLAMADNHRDYVGKWGDGKEVVGVNNVGEIRFDWGDGDAKSVIQQLWWRLESNSNATNPPAPHPLTKCIVSLRFADSRYPQPAV
jgi:hypothetical protein